jgi:hypothetical protein
MDIGGQIMDNKLSDFRRIRIEIIHGRYNVWGVLAWLSLQKNDLTWFYIILHE